MRSFASAWTVLAPLALIDLVAIYTGAYNVAAGEPHSGLGRWTCHATMENSVRTRAKEPRGSATRP